jgi:DNA-binding response OmpR family regulator
MKKVTGHGATTTKAEQRSCARLPTKPRRRVHVGEKIVSLTPLQWRLFEYLVENEGHIATYRKLLAAGWDNPGAGTERRVKVQISLLREKLNDPPYDSRYIHTIREEGYLFEVRTNGL